jgi:hypothetical protein
VGSYGNEGNSERGFERKEMLFSKDEWYNDNFKLFHCFSRSRPTS